MDYFETDSNSSAPKRVPLSLRLPVQVVESVDRYASENRMSKTDAFLHFLRRGMDAERGELRLDQLVEIKEQLSEIKGMLLEKRGDRSEEAAFVREAVAPPRSSPQSSARTCSALSRGVRSVRIAMSTSASNTTMACPSTCMMCRSSGSASSRLPGARSTWFPLIVLKRRAWLRP